MNAIDLLEEQHRNVEGIFAKLEKGKGETAPLLGALADALAAHMAIEHELFYPAATEFDADMIHEGFEEHAIAEIALKRLLSSAPESESFRARLKAFKELVQHHVKEEEEELFPKVAAAMGEERLDQLGVAMQARFAEVAAAGYDQLVPKGVEQTSSDLANPARGAGRPTPTSTSLRKARARGSASARRKTSSAAKPATPTGTKRAQPASRGAQRAKGPAQRTRTPAKKARASGRARAGR